LLLKFVKEAKLALNVSDLWLDTAVAMGMVRSGIVLRTCRWLEKLIYRQSELITGQTRGIVEGIESHVTGKQACLITNGAEIPVLLQHGEDVAATRKKFGWNETFVVGYIGTHGLVHGLETVLEAAKLLAEHKEIRFVLFGDGTDKERLVALAEKRELKNITFYPPQPRAQIVEILRCFDVALVPVRGLELLRGALPSKMFEVMGAGIPVVASLSGEAQEVIEEARGGICVRPEDYRAIADAVLRLFKDPGLRAEMGASGRRYVLKHFSRRDIAEKYERLVCATVVRRALGIRPTVAASSDRIAEQYSKASEIESGR
jgi:glycosyltransferase involved in cell wall biosynthesis